MSVLYTSDLHFDHQYVAETRGFTSTTEHDDAVCDNWVSQVRKRDTVWVLGDLGIASGRARVEAVLARIASLPGTKHLVSGNHDQCHPMHRDSHNWQRTYLSAFDSVQPFARQKIAGESVMLSHFPYTADRGGEERCGQYRLRDEGLPLLHGHTHSWRPFEPNTVNQIHVGLDAHSLQLATREWVELVLPISKYKARYAHRYMRKINQ